MKPHTTATNPAVVAEREHALRTVEAAARASRDAAARDERAIAEAAARRHRGSVLDVVTPLLFLVLVLGMLALVAMGASVR